MTAIGKTPPGANFNQYTAQNVAPTRRATSTQGGVLTQPAGGAPSTNKPAPANVVDFAPTSGGGVPDSAAVARLQRAAAPSTGESGHWALALYTIVQELGAEIVKAGGAEDRALRDRETAFRDAQITKERGAAGETLRGVQNSNAGTACLLGVTAGALTVASSTGSSGETAQPTANTPPAADPLAGTTASNWNTEGSTAGLDAIKQGAVADPVGASYASAANMKGLDPIGQGAVPDPLAGSTADGWSNEGVAPGTVHAPDPSDPLGFTSASGYGTEGDASGLAAIKQGAVADPIGAGYASAANMKGLDPVGQGAVSDPLAGSTADGWSNEGVAPGSVPAAGKSATNVAQNAPTGANIPDTTEGANGGATAASATNATPGQGASPNPAENHGFLGLGGARGAGGATAVTALGQYAQNTGDTENQRAQGNSKLLSSQAEEAGKGADQAEEAQKAHREHIKAIADAANQMVLQRSEDVRIKG